jgi:hypothetical protein
MRKFSSKKSLSILCLILAGACVTAGVSSKESSRSDASANQTLILNVKVYSDQFSGDAVLIRGSKIDSMGDSKALRDKCNESCAIVDGKGGFLMPGFHDSHIHLIDASKAYFDFQTSLTKINQITDPNQPFQKALKSYILSHPEKTWIYGGNWLVTSLKNHITKSDLDAIESEKPVVLRDYSGHELWVNSKALKLAHIDQSTPDPVGGKIVRDSAGNPTGVLLETATYAIRQLIPPPTLDEFEKYILKGQEQTLALGLTSVEGASVPLTMLETQAYVDLDKRGLLRQRSFLWGNLLAFENDFKAMVEFAKGLPENGKVKIVAFKGFVDGTLTSSTAAMIEPYSGNPKSYGSLKLTQEQLNYFVLRANKAGFPAALHAMGDKAVQMTLNAFEYSQKILGKKFNNRVEHATVISNSDFVRFKSLGAIASVQPNFMYYQSFTTFPFFKTLGQDRIKRLYAWKSLADVGAFLIFGSDHPDGGSSKADPITGLFCATKRLFRDGSSLSPDQRIDGETALRAYTVNPAIAIGMGDKLGKVAPGYNADLIILDQDPRDSSARTIDENKIRMKMIDGIIL